MLVQHVAGPAVAEGALPGYPFGRSHLNVKTLFAIATGLGREVGMGGAYRQLGWEIEGVHHHGDDGAGNIAGVLCMLLKRMRG